MAATGSSKLGQRHFSQQRSRDSPLGHTIVANVHKVALPYTLRLNQILIVVNAGLGLF